MIRRAGAVLVLAFLAGKVPAGSATLDADLFWPAIPPVVQENFQIRANVRNLQAYSSLPSENASNVTPNLAINSDDGAEVIYVSGPTPASVGTLEGGATASFTWVYQAAQPGVLNMTVTFTGTDNSGAAILNEERIDSGTLLIADADLYATIYLTPAVVARGRDVLVTAVVGNYGVNPAGFTVPLTYTANGCGIPSEILVTSADGGSVFETAGPYPDCSADLDPGEEVSYSWTFTASEAGIVDIAVNFSATGDGIPYSIVQTQASEQLVVRDLCAVANVSPERLTVGQNVTLYGKVSVCGPVAETGIVPLSYTASGCGLPLDVGINPAAAVLPLSGPQPDCPVSLSPGQESTFTWVFATTTTGVVAFTVSFTGLGTGLPPFPRAAATAELIIQSPAKLSVTLWSDPIREIPYQQDVLVYMKISNIGEATADLVAPLMQTVSGTGSLLPLECAPGVACPLWDGYPPLPIVQILGGKSAVFTWRYQAQSPGYAVLTSAASGVDYNTRQPVISPYVLLPLQLPRPQALSLTVTGAAGLMRGQEFLLAVSAINPSSVTEICQAELSEGGFRVLLNGSPEHMEILEVLPPIPRCYERCGDCPPDALLNCCQREFTLRVRLGQNAPLGPGQLTVTAAGLDGAGVATVSAANILPVTIWAAEPGIASATPNPFRLSRSSSVRIKYVVSAEQGVAPVALKLYTISGELVATIVNEPLAPGLHEVDWDGRNADGHLVASGIYILLLQGQHGQDVSKLAVIK